MENVCLNFVEFLINFNPIVSHRAASLERSYLTYSHRQRQKSLIIVNAVDLVLKFVLAAVYIIQRQENVIFLFPLIVMETEQVEVF